MKTTTNLCQNIIIHARKSHKILNMGVMMILFRECREPLKKLYNINKTSENNTKAIKNPDKP